jgi:hypothetical protein
MTSLGHPKRFQSKGTLNLVHHLLGWSAPVHAGRIRAGTTPLGDLAAGEFMLFVSYVSCGLALPISPFFWLLLEELELQLQHLTPHSILQATIFVHLYEMFVGVAPCTSLFRHFFVLVKSGKAKDHLGAYYFQTRSDSAVAYIPTLGARKVGKLAHRLGGRQRRGQRPPRPAERRASTRSEAIEGQAIAGTGVLARARQNQDLGNRWSDLHACGRRLSEASDRAVAEEGAPVLLVHRPERHRPDPARAGYRPVLGGARTSDEGDYG